MRRRRSVWPPPRPGGRTRPLHLPQPFVSAPRPGARFELSGTLRSRPARSGWPASARRGEGTACWWAGCCRSSRRPPTRPAYRLRPRSTAAARPSGPERSTPTSRSIPPTAPRAASPARTGSPCRSGATAGGCTGSSAWCTAVGMPSAKPRVWRAQLSGLRASHDLGLVAAIHPSSPQVRPAREKKNASISTNRSRWNPCCPGDIHWVARP